MNGNPTLQKQHPTPTTKILQINLRHCKAASALLAKTIDDYNIDIIMIQEPYATKRLDKFELSHPGRLQRTTT